MSALIGMFVAAVGVVAIAKGVALGWLLAVAGIAPVVGSYFPIRAIRQGRNPSWMRSPLDRRWHTSLWYRVVGIVLMVLAGAWVLLGVMLILRNLVA